VQTCALPIWLGELWEFPISPVVITAMHDDTTDTATVSANPFGCGLYDRMRPMFQRLEEVACRAEGIVCDQRKVVFACNRCDSIKIRDIEASVTNGLSIDGFGILINQSFYLVGFRVCRKASLNTQMFK